MFKNIYKTLTKLFLRFYPNISYQEKEIYLIFHSVSSNTKEDIYSINIKQFEKLCSFIAELKKMHYKTYKKKLNITLTFDDGYDDFFYNALPIIQKYKLKTILFFIVKNITDKNEGFLNLKQLELIKSNPLIRLGVHGYSHIDLTKFKDNELKSEILNIKNTLKSAKLSTNLFSLPFGRGSDEILECLSREGFTNIYTSEYGKGNFDKGIYKAYPRIDIWASDDTSEIYSKLNGYWKLFFWLESKKSKIYIVK